MLGVVAGLIESGLDISGIAPADDSVGAAHEIHGHLGSGDDSPSGDEGDVEHFCHCVTHGAALAFSMEFAIQMSEAKINLSGPEGYRSLAIPPPVPPPNA
jgi:hypothetical protein